MASGVVFNDASEMNTSCWQRAMLKWREQKLAQFGRRAHRHFGRGFVLFDGDEDAPMYVTWLAGAPDPLRDAVYEYDPQHEALVVSAVNESDVFISQVRIEEPH